MPLSKCRTQTLNPQSAKVQDTYDRSGVCVCAYVCECVCVCIGMHYPDPARARLQLLVHRTRRPAHACHNLSSQFGLPARHIPPARDCRSKLVTDLNITECVCERERARARARAKRGAGGGERARAREREREPRRHIDLNKALLDDGTEATAAAGGSVAVDCPGCCAR